LIAPTQAPSTSAPYVATNEVDPDEAQNLVLSGYRQEPKHIKGDLEETRRCNKANDLLDKDANGNFIPRCAFEIQPGSRCNLPCGNSRKVISHLFGRNKNETRQLGGYIYITWCRKHYQRAFYRMNKQGNFGTVQVGLAGGALLRMRQANVVDSFNIRLRNREVVRRLNLDPPGILPEGVKVPKPTKKKPEKPQNSENNGNKIQKDEKRTRRSPTITGCPVPDWMLDFCGMNKSFQDVFDMLHELRSTNVKVDPVLSPDPMVMIKEWPDIEMVPNVNPEWNAEEDSVSDIDDNCDESCEEDSGNDDSGAGSKRKRGSDVRQGSSKKQMTIAASASVFQCGPSNPSTILSTVDAPIASSVSSRNSGTARKEARPSH
jgi:hypothetical protein